MARGHRQHDGVELLRLALRQAQGNTAVRLRRDRDNGRGEVDGVEARCRGLREMRERHRRESEARRRCVAQERRPQHEQRVGRGDAIERRVERRNEERIPECPRARPRLVCCAAATARTVRGVCRPDGYARYRAIRSGCARPMRSFSPRREVRIGRETRRAGEAAPVTRRRSGVRSCRCAREFARRSDPADRSLSSIPTDRANRMNSVQHAKKTCCPLSTSTPSISNDVARPPSRRLRSKSSTCAPALFEAQRRRKSGEPAADDGYALESHDRTTTRSFSVLESAARARSGSPGSRSIFLSSSS